MQYRHLIRTVVLVFSLVGAACADTLTLKDGRTVTGIFLGGSARQIRMEVGDSIQTFGIDRVANIQFGSGQAVAPAAEQAPPAPQEPTSGFRQERPSDMPAATSGTELPAGTTITIRMIDPVDSQVNNVGQTFRASVDEPVVVGSDQVIPRGADALVKLADDKQSGKISGKTVLTLALVSVSVNGRMVDVNSQSVERESSSRTERSEKVIGGTAALGAIIGAIGLLGLGGLLALIGVIGLVLGLLLHYVFLNRLRHLGR